MSQRWPDRLWIVRHGQSAGNVARDAAHDERLARIALGFLARELLPPAFTADRNLLGCVTRHQNGSDDLANDKDWCVARAIEPTLK